MKLLYHETDLANFGDDMNDKIWRTLVPQIDEDSSDANGFMGIGTIIGKRFPKVDHLHVFSSGSGYDPIQFQADKVTVWCVRGPLTARILKQTEDKALTDGAVLSPLVYPAAQKSGKTLFIPHWQTVHGLEDVWNEVCEGAGITLMSPVNTPEDVISAISAADRVITESLHGAILADTYGVPWTACTFSSNFSSYKWADWTSSVKVPFYLHTLTAPSPELFKLFGRPARRGVTEIDAEDEYADMVSWDVAKEEGAKLGPAPNKGGLKSILKAAAYSGPIAAMTMGVKPATTIKQFRDIIDGNHFYLSDSELRSDLRREMLSRLQKCMDSVGVPANLHAHM
ncbi:MAG: polysaccharide pyruvyl transferase family protein [Pseudomonadota bacterium]